MNRLNTLFASAALLAIVPLAACSDAEPVGNEAAAATTEAGETLASAIGEAPGLTTVSGALSEAGLAEVFDGPGSYTVLAPDDEAFAALGADGKTLTQADHRAELVAVLRGHILPGHLTPEAIKKAIADKKGPVTVRTLADGAVTFSADGDTITVAGADGATAKIDGSALVATNGVVLPLDGLVKKAPPATS